MGGNKEVYPRKVYAGRRAKMAAVTARGGDNKRAMTFLFA